MRLVAIERWATSAATYRGLGDFAFLNELLEVRTALDELEGALFLYDLGRATHKIALTADGSHQARSLYAPAEFANGGKRAFIAAF